MTREEQLIQAGKNSFYKKYPKDQIRFSNEDNIEKEYVEAFIDGMKCADNNPNWHKYPDEKPTKYDSYECWVCNFNIILEYIPETDRWIGNSCVCETLEYDNVEAWKELTKCPKFD